MVKTYWVNSIMSGRNPPSYCTLTLIAMQGHQQKGRQTNTSSNNKDKSIVKVPCVPLAGRTLLRQRGVAQFHHTSKTKMHVASGDIVRGTTLPRSLSFGSRSTAAHTDPLNCTRAEAGLRAASLGIQEIRFPARSSIRLLLTGAMAHVITAKSLNLHECYSKLSTPFLQDIVSCGRTEE